jgi:hypothetical protein
VPRALDLYKENSALNEKLNTFFAAINNVPALKGAVQFPSLQVSQGAVAEDMNQAEFNDSAMKGVV